MIQQEQPDHYVIATGEMYSVRAFCEKAFGRVGLNYEDHVEIDPRYFRPAEVDLLLGDPSKAKASLGWKLRVSFDDLVAMMVDHDLELAAQERTLRDAGHALPDHVGHDQ